MRLFKLLEEEEQGCLYSYGLVLPPARLIPFWPTLIRTFNHLWLEVAKNMGTYRTYPRMVGECGGKNFHLIHSSADIGTDRLRLPPGRSCVIFGPTENHPSHRPASPTPFFIFYFW